MNVLVVARTRMQGGRVCIGALTESGASVRLLEPGGGYPPGESAYQVGDWWDAEFTPSGRCRAPHVEDVLVHKSRRVAQEADLAAYLRARVTPWRGSPDALFDGVLGWTQTRSGYAAERTGTPPCSTGFWVPDVHLTFHAGDSYFYLGLGAVYHLRYVGVVAPTPAIPARTLVRVSLAKWWRPADAAPDLEERCYLQLSGWYG